MQSESRQDVTTILNQLRQGDASAADRLVEIVYHELRRAAGHLMRRERIDHTLQPTALVNEALIRLLESGALRQARSRSYFFGAASRAMRQVLVDHARRRAANKRGGDRDREPLDQVLAGFEQKNLDVLALDEALQALEAMNSRQSEIVTRRFFGGLTMNEIAEQLEVSLGTVENDFRVARAWLRGKLRGFAE